MVVLTQHTIFLLAGVDLVPGAPWWVAAIYVALTVLLIPAAKFLWDWITGKTKRQLDEVDMLVKLAKNQAAQIGELVQQQTKTEREKGELQQKLDQLTNLIEDLQSDLEKERAVTAELREEVAGLRQQLVDFTTKNASRDR